MYTMSTMNKIIIGIVGPIASGKGLLVDHLKEIGFHAYSLSDEVRKEARTRNLSISREVLQNLGDELREKFGSQVLAERALFSAIGEEKNLVFDSIRNPGEIFFLKNLSDIKIIGVDAPPEIRAKWYLQRAKDRGEDVPDLDHFFKASLRDSGFHENASGQQVDKCMQLADIKLLNAGTKDDILKGLDRYLENELRFDTEIHRRYKEK